MTINDALMAVFTLTAFFQINKQRSIYILLCGIMFLIHDYLSSELSDQMYYFSACVVDATAVIMAMCLSPVTKAVRCMQKICMSFCIANMYGFIIWYLYLPPLSYNLLCTVLYVLLIFTTLKSEARGVMGSDSLLNFVFHRHCFGDAEHKENKGEK